MEKIIMQKPKFGFYRCFFKRVIDLFLSFMSIIILSPVIIIISLLVRFKLGSPIIFKQKRPGLHGKVFTMYKFRTMNNLKDDQGKLFPDSVRLTKFGKMLRSTSLDELPELINIIKGEMSFVGPRPQLVKDMVFMTEEQKHRHDVLPGLTGLAQINGRNDISWEDKLNLDLKYIQKINFFKDSKIFILTFIKVFIRDGVSTSGMDTAEDYGDYLLRTNKITLTEYNNRITECERLLKIK